jgi:hypothetical protein
LANALQMAWSIGSGSAMKTGETNVKSGQTGIRSYSPAVVAILDRLDAGVVRDVTAEFERLTPDEMRELAAALVARVQAAMERQRPFPN